MIRIAKGAATTAALALTLTSCSVLNRNKGTSQYEVRGSAARTPTVAELTSRFGCTTAQIAQNWQRNRLVIARAGTPLCNVLGRYGDPISVSTSSVADMQLVSMLHREPNGRYYNATFVYYSDTKVNRQLRRPVGQWIVDRVTATR